MVVNLVTGRIVKHWVMIFYFFRGGWGVACKAWGGWVGGMQVWRGGDLGKVGEGDGGGGGEKDLSGYFHLKCSHLCY